MTRSIAYTVQGHWPFPVDMLRHDCSHAASADDQAMIDALSGNYAPDRAAFADVEINLIGPHKPNTARWESFSWAVPNDREHATFKRWKAEAATEKVLLASALAKLNDDERRLIEARMSEGRH